jgi:iron(III) transport system ATP-binding protein
VSLAVSIDQLQCRRGSFQLGPVSLEVQAGARVDIVGPSGSGKTTLLRCLAGLQAPDSGTIQVGDTVVDDADKHLPPVDRHLGLVFQDGALWPQMTALKHLRFAAPGLSKKDALSLLERGGILAQAKKKPGAMSGGEAQRLGLLRALAPKPAVLLLDEPLRSVDVHQRDGLVLLLRSMCDERNVTSILVTHDRDEALALADHLVVMRDGQLVEQGDSIDLLEQPRTAFTAAFLRGAACLSATPIGNGKVATVLGEFDAPPGDHADVRLVVKMAMAPKPRSSRPHRVTATACACASHAKTRY